VFRPLHPEDLLLTITEWSGRERIGSMNRVPRSLTEWDVVKIVFAVITALAGLVTVLKAVF
jgi:hypothetical protein